MLENGALLDTCRQEKRGIGCFLNLICGRAIRRSPPAAAGRCHDFANSGSRPYIVKWSYAKRGVGLLATLACLLSDLVSAAAPVDLLTEDGCSAAVDEPGSNEPRFREIPGLSILEWNPKMPLRIPGVGAEIKGILCWRSDARFSANDYLVALAGLPLYVKTDYVDETRNRTVVLENTNAGFRIRLLSGPEFSSPELEEMRRLIKHYNTARKRHEAQRSITSKPKRPAVDL